MNKKFALIGVAGYIAPRHLKAIKETGNTLVAATDPFDSVGILDKFFDNVDYFKEFERFDRHAEKLRRKDKNNAIDYVSICSPNFLHDAHIRFALRIDADAICEKPIVLNPWNLDALRELENECKGRVYTVYQVRLHPSIVDLKKKMQNSGTRKSIDLTYITGRGNWYLYSWKGDIHKAGGLATNIGIHFFDMLTWIFGKPEKVEVHLKKKKKIGGYLELENADVRWFLSIDKSDISLTKAATDERTYRSLEIDGKEVEFNTGFADLHTLVYEKIFQGKGFKLEDARTSIELVHRVRHSNPVTPQIEHVHPIVRKLR